MEGLRQPEKLVLSENAEINWKKFKQSLEIYLEASGLSTASESRKIALLLNIAGPEALEVYNTFDKKCISTFDSVIKLFEEHAIPRNNVIINSYNFFNMRQKDISFDQFLTDLKTQAKICDFQEENQMIRDMLVIGVADRALQERLLRESDLTLNQAVKICRAAEAGKTQLEKMREKEIYAVRATTSGVEKTRNNRINECNRCGKSHLKFECPAFGKRCAACQKYNHFAAMCVNKRYNKSPKVKKVHCVEDEEQSRDENFNVDSLFSVSSIQKEQWTQNVIINDVSVQFKLDTGADCNTLSSKVFNDINKDNKARLKESQTVLVVYTIKSFKITLLLKK